ncbi:unnamed protein product [Hymenolepis diminuta]|uniref:DDE Tnp4 domain-containing protein n=1 Tax=Hymenolepis diminuta TaxID=6216 RepID=A0A0R3SPQ3_HYMDI|nr:unnamed protein product [Hymenolepis diminuta]
MTDTTTNEMKRHALLVSAKAKHNNLGIARLLIVARCFVYKVRKQLNENNEDELATTRKRKQHCQRSADSLTAPEFVRRVHYMMDKNSGNSTRHILPNIFVCLKEQQTIGNVVHRDPGYKSHTFVGETSIMSRHRSLGVMIDICLGIYVQTRKRRARPPVDTVVEISSSVNHF